LSQWFPKAARHYDDKSKGGKVIGVTHFVPKVSWVSRPRKDGMCQLESYIVVHAAAIYLPAVTDNPSLPSTVEAWFMQEYERIKAHELIHHAYNQEYLNRLERYLSEMPYEDSCDALTQMIKDYSKKLGEYTKAQHNQFDDREYNQHVAIRNYEARLAFENEKARLINEAA
jgi:predicted secreted Zn-dependent protease